MNRWKKGLAVSLLVASIFLQGTALVAADMEGLLGEIKAYDYGQSRENLTKISDIIREAGTDATALGGIEKQLAAFLDTDATFAAKQFVCKQLSLIGTEQSVAVLAKMLTDEKESDMARYALERIPGDSVDSALRGALGKTKGKTQVGIINTIAVRGDLKAVAALVKLMDSSDNMVASAVSYTHLTLPTNREV